MSSRGITLALGGGGARGVAHLGVVEVLQRAGYTIDRVVGVSSGSLAGALLAFSDDALEAQRKALSYLLSDKFQSHQQTLFGASPSADEDVSGGVFSWYDRVKDYLRANRIFHRVISRASLLPGIVLNDVVDSLLPDADISDARIPLSVVAVDLLSGDKVVLEKGSIRDAVRASSSLPGIFPAVKMDGMLLCDIGVFYSLPTTVARTYGPHCLVAVEVATGTKPMPKCETALDALMRMDEIGETLFRKHVREAADLVIQPAVSGTEWFDFSDPELMLAAGRAAAEKALPNLETLFRKNCP